MILKRVQPPAKSSWNWIALSHALSWQWKTCRNCSGKSFDWFAKITCSFLLRLFYLFVRRKIRLIQLELKFLSIKFYSCQIDSNLLIMWQRFSRVINLFFFCAGRHSKAVTYKLTIKVIKEQRNLRELSTIVAEWKVLQMHEISETCWRMALKSKRSWESFYVNK